MCLSVGGLGRNRRRTVDHLHGHTLRTFARPLPASDFLDQPLRACVHHFAATTASLPSPCIAAANALIASPSIMVLPSVSSVL